MQGASGSSTKKTMIDVTIEELCEEIRATWECGRTPVDLVHIASEEGIELAPGEYGPGFHGRLEYIKNEHLFVLYHPAAFTTAPHVRVRFTIAHELGHFYLPAHRDPLMTGHSPDCQIGFISDKASEREADTFAASLLIPRHLLQTEIDRRGMMTLQSIIGMARDLEVSIPCAVIRYVHYAPEACGVVVSEAGKVKYYISSDEMSAKGFRFMARQEDIPRDSKAWSLLTTEQHRVVEGTKTNSGKWYSKRPQSMDLWEDSMSLGYSDQVITLLSQDS